LFQTPVLARQVQKFIETAGVTGVTRERMHEVFSDVNRSTFDYAIAKMLKRNAIECIDGSYRSTGLVEVGGAKADRAWKAARILHTFTAKQLALTADVPIRYAIDLCQTWLTARYINRIGSLARDSLYRMVSKEIVRPVRSRPKEKL
jgi:hypothetical protein